VRWGVTLCYSVEESIVVKLIAVAIAVVYLVDSGKGGERRR
jgi:hypothetical protein